MKLSNLLNKDLNIVQKRKIFFLIPAIIVVIAIVAMIIFGVVTGSPLKLGMDFTGGYTINVKLSTKLTEDTRASYVKDIRDTVEGLTNAVGEPYNIKVSAIVSQGSDENASLNVKYKAAASEAVMEDEINPAVQEALQTKIFKILPRITNSGTAFTVDYGNFTLTKSTFNEMEKSIKSVAAANSATTVSDIKLADDGKKITFTADGSTDDFVSSVKSELTIADTYSGMAVKGNIISATVSGELLINAILAICLAIVLMLVYIAFRFEISSGVAAIVALFHDIIIMFSFMAIFHIEINSTFIAALITILGYSINNTIIIFDRIRENVKSVFHKTASATFIANRSITETMLRSINTTITTMLTILMVALIGVPDIRIFALPIIVGLLSGAFSSVCIAPSVWAMWKDRKSKGKKMPSAKINEDNAEKVITA